MARLMRGSCPGAGQVARLENAVAHLMHSNTELEAALQAGADSDFSEAIVVSFLSPANCFCYRPGLLCSQ